MVSTQGLVQIHAAPAPLCPHIEWALEGVLGVAPALNWTPQPAERATYRAEVTWCGPVGTAARLASAMKRWDRVRFEVTEDASATSDGERYSYTPLLGVFHAYVARSGDILIHEDALRAALLKQRAGDVQRAIQQLLGEPWDAELDAFRAADADAGASVRWLNRTG